MCPWSHRRSVAYRRPRTEVLAPSERRVCSPVLSIVLQASRCSVPCLAHVTISPPGKKLKWKKIKKATFFKGFLKLGVFLISFLKKKNLGFFISFSLCVCLCAHFVFQLYPKHPGLCSWLISVFWGLFSFDKMLLAVLYLLLYILPPLIYSYLYHTKRIKQFWFFPMILRNAIFITGYSQRRRKENLRVFPSAVFLSRNGVCPSPPLFCSGC